MVFSSPNLAHSQRRATAQELGLGKALENRMQLKCLQNAKTQMRVTCAWIVHIYAGTLGCHAYSLTFRLKRISTAVELLRWTITILITRSISTLHWRLHARVVVHPTTTDAHANVMHAPAIFCVSVNQVKVAAVKHLLGHVHVQFEDSHS